MIRLSLYDLPALAEVERAEPLALGPACRRCKLGEREGLRHRCVPDDGAEFAGPGGLLVVGEGPGVEEDRQNRPWVGQTGQYVRRQVARHWKGSIVWANATRCAPPRDAKDLLLEKAVDACRGYLRATIDEVAPARVLALGAWSAASILGQALPPFSSRGGFGWLWADGRAVPVHTLIHPAAALRNRFVRGWFEEDLRRALTEPSPRPPPWNDAVRLVETEEDALAAAAELRRARWVAFDLEAFGRIYSAGFRVLAAGLCAAGSTSPWVWTFDALASPSARRPLVELLADPRLPKVEQNGKYDGQAVRAAWGVEVANLHVDTRLGRHVLEPEADAHLAKQAVLVGMAGHKAENARHIEMARSALRAWSPRERKDGSRPKPRHDSPLDALARSAELHPEAFVDDPRSCLARDDWFDARMCELAGRMDADELDVWAYGLVPRRVLYRYNGLDAVTTALLGDEIETRLADNERAGRVWNVAVRPASTAVEQVETWGVSVSREAMSAFAAYLKIRVNDARQRLAAYGDFDPDSTPQVRDLLFKRLRLAPVALTDTGLPSSAKDALKLMVGQHPVVADLVEFRRFGKLRSSLAGWQQCVQDDERIHPSLNVDGARTGRLSSSNPNLHSVDRAQTDEGKLARDCFTASEGMELVEGDFAQLELRVMAMLSGDPKMRAIFERGDDILWTIARYLGPIVWKLAAEEVGEAHRSKTKGFVYGIAYGMTDGGVMARTGCTKREAQDIRAAVMGDFRRLDSWMRDCLKRARMSGGSWTWWAGEDFRWRPLWRLGDADQESGQVVTAQNGATNSPIQGTANEFCLASLVRLVDWIRRTRFPARLVLTVHDSILGETPPDRAAELAAKMREVMTSWDSRGVPLKVDFKRGRSWGSMEKFDVPS